MTAMTGHIPVLLQEVISGLAPQAGKLYIDATFGRGGYTRAILESADCRVIGIDRDPEAISMGKQFEQEFPERFQILKGSFSQLTELLQSINVTKIDGIAFDFGVSSPQLDTAERGFSFRMDGPLDMRMGDEGQTAADLVNTESEEDLANIIYRYGEEHASRKIARAIVNKRVETPFTRTSELADLIASIMPRRDETHPATKTFQAIRIAVNDELREIEIALPQTENLLNAGGRLAVVTFHSLEDRIVKNFLRDRSGKNSHGSRHRPQIVQDNAPTFKLVANKAIKPSNDEVRSNPRARSSKLRVAERIGEVSHAA